MLGRWAETLNVSGGTNESIKSNRSAITMLTADVREQMIEQQVRAWDVLDERVLQILRKVPRERFTPEQQRFRAYAAGEVPLPHDQLMLRPSVVGRLLQALEIKSVVLV